MDPNQLNKDLAIQWMSVTPAVSAYVASMVPQHADAAEIVQAVALAIVEKYDRYDPARPFLAWALGVARFEVLNWRRKHGHDRHVFSEKSMTHIESACTNLAGEIDQRIQALATCMEELDANSRTILQQRYREDLKPRHIAEATGMQPAAVSMKLSRIRAALRHCITRRMRLDDPANHTGEADA